MNYIIFGAGQTGLETLEILDSNKVSFFIDNNIKKINTKLGQKNILSFENGIKERKNELIVIAVSKIYENELINQLKKNNIKEFCTFSELKMKITKEKIANRPDYLEIYKKAIRWIHNNTILGEGIINNSKLKKSYPEVTGYFIPTLLNWGYREEAISYAKWLCKIQKGNGSWFDTDNESAYVFDSAQILKGLIAVRDIYPELDIIDEVIVKGCDWIVSCMTPEGQLKTPNESAWGNIATELIHTYCLSPLKEAGRIYSKTQYEEAANKILDYYIKNNYNEITNFCMLSHFYAYVIEAMLDMGEEKIAKKAMCNVEKYQKESGAVPAYSDVNWVCSTGLFQLALIWFRIGDWNRGNKAFEYACKLQNSSGGWFGSYISEENNNEINTYFPNSEISWAVKYFLDALYYRNILQFEMQADLFRSDLSDCDDKYIILNNIVRSLPYNKKILDVGCGKGRYIKKLKMNNPRNSYYAIDISKKVMNYIADGNNIEKKIGNITYIPYDNNTFDVVYACEVLEHAIDIKSSIKEMARVTTPKGKIVIIDKNKSMYGFFDIEEWEQWFDKEELSKIMYEFCEEVLYIDNINYDNEESNGLFGAWIGTVK